MNASQFTLQIEQWIRLTYLLPGANDRDHCHGIRKSFAFLGGPHLDFLSFRHQEPVAWGAPHAFTVNLWRCIDGAVTAHTVRDMGLSLVLFRAKYAQLLEDAECRGWRRRHRFNVQGHMIGARVERTPLIDTLSMGSGEMAFWTFTEEAGRLSIEPYYVDVEVEQGAVQLEEVLDHLTWDPGQEELGEAGPTLRSRRQKNVLDPSGAAAVPSLEDRCPPGGVPHRR